ncbi:putative secreted protein [Cladobotryum mycophilum]|uniref:Secreted protein n=1 Tax=Cladobotryum mycophilum TaxID=491253 RepID=A0ABR0STB4_9HYPO
MYFLTPLTLGLSLCLTGLASADVIKASTPAIKDATILQGTAPCPACPEQNCSKCTLGKDKIFQATSEEPAFGRSLIGFRIPQKGSPVSSCRVQFPAFVKLYNFPVNVTFSQALSSKWDEATVSGENAPESGDVFVTVNVPALQNMGSVDITPACKGAAKNGLFSIYVGTESKAIEIWSKDSENPAILHIEY